MTDLSVVSRSDARRRRGLIALLSAIVLTVALGTSAGSALAVTAPSLTIDSPTEVEYTTAHVSGTIDPEAGGTAINWSFQYSTNPSDPFSWVGGAGGTINEADASGSSPISVEGNLTGLKPGQEYSVRLFAYYESFAASVATDAPYPTLTTEAVAPPTASLEPPTGISPDSATLHALINPGAPAGNPSAFDVHWLIECTPECQGINEFGNEAVINGTIPADGSNHAIAREVPKLKTNTTYEVTLTASNAGGTTTDTLSFTTATSAPPVETLYGFTLPGGTEAVLAGAVDAKNEPTRYWFEYGPTQAYGNSIPSGEDGDGGSGETAIVVAQRIDGLAPNSEYHFRIVAENATGRTYGLDRTLNTTVPEGGLGSSVGKLVLPDDRAWEMVSPVNKNNGDVWKAVGVPSPSGDGVLFKSQSAFAGQPSAKAGMLGYYLARRGATSWQTKGVEPPGGNYLSTIGYEVFNPELTSGIRSHSDAANTLLVPSAPSGINLYRHELDSSQWQLLNPGANVTENQDVVGASNDQTRIYFTSSRGLTPDSPCDPDIDNGGHGRPVCAYEWHNGSLQLASVLPDGTPSFGNSMPTNALSQNPNQLVGHLVSEDGSHFFFTVAGALASSEIFVRVDGDETIQVSASERTDPPVDIPSNPVQGLVRAEPAHGEKVLFQSNLELVDEDEDDLKDLYLWDQSKPAGERLTLVSQGDLPGGNLVGLFEASRDLSRIYFVTESQLQSGQPEIPGPKLYLWEDGDSAPTLTFVTTLAPTVVGHEMEANNFDLAPARTDATGRYLAFRSSRQLTGYDNAGFEQIYRYDALDHTLVCVSCRATGAAPSERATLDGFGDFDEGNAINSTSFPKDWIPQNVSATGQVFFESPDALVPQDSNGQTDVYLWQNGRPYLISGGTGREGSKFLSASRSGNDVFFATSQRLVGWDIDDSFDVYDARVGGGLPEPPPGVIGCEGDACQPPPTPPNDPTPASAAFNGPGNVKPPHKKKHHKKHRAKNKHQKKKHAKKQHAKKNSTRKNG